MPSMNAPQELLPPPSEDETLPYTPPDFHELQRVYTSIRGKKPRKISKRDFVAGQFADAFDLIGGVPRLAFWANEDPGEFFKLYARLIPAEQKTEVDGRIEIVSFIQPTKIDGLNVSTDQT